MSEPKELPLKVRIVILRFLKGELKYKEAAKAVGKSNTAFAFMVVEYSRWIVQKGIKK